MYPFKYFKQNKEILDELIDVLYYSEDDEPEQYYLLDDECLSEKQECIPRIEMNSFVSYLYLKQKSLII